MLPYLILTPDDINQINRYEGIFKLIYRGVDSSKKTYSGNRVAETLDEPPSLTRQFIPYSITGCGVMSRILIFPIDDYTQSCASGGVATWRCRYVAVTYYWMAVSRVPDAQLYQAPCRILLLERY